MIESDYRKILDKLSHLEKGLDVVKKEIHLIKEKVVDDSILSDDDKTALDEAVKEEKEGRLSSKNKVFG